MKRCLSFLCVIVLTGVWRSFALGVFEGPPTLVGTVLPRPKAAPGFTLVDQHGLAFRMADAKGKVVVMSFAHS